MPTLFDKAALDRQAAMLPSHLTTGDVGELPDSTTSGVSAPSSGFPWDAAAATIGGNALDSLTTWQALHRASNIHETNPLLGQNPLGIAALKAALTVPEVLAEHYVAQSGHPKIARALGYGIGAFGTLAALHNARVGR